MWALYNPKLPQWPLIGLLDLAGDLLLLIVIGLLCIMMYDARCIFNFNLQLRLWAVVCGAESVTVGHVGRVGVDVDARGGCFRLCVLVLHVNGVLYRRHVHVRANYMYGSCMTD